MDTAQKNYSVNRKEASTFLDVSARTLDRYIKSGKLSHRKKGNKVFLSRRELGQLKDIKTRLEADLEAKKGGVVDSPVYNSAEGKTNVDSAVHINNRRHKKVNNGLVDRGVDTNVHIDTVDIDSAVQINNGHVKNERTNFVDNGVYVDVDNVDSAVDVDMDKDVYITPHGEKVSSQNGDKKLVESIYKVLYEEAREEINDKQQKLEGANYKVGQLENQLKNMVPMLEYKKEQKKLLAQGEQFEKEKKQLESEIDEREVVIKKEKINRVVVSVILFTMLILQPVFWLIWRYYNG